MCMLTFKVSIVFKLDVFMKFRILKYTNAFKERCPGDFRRTNNMTAFLLIELTSLICELYSIYVRIGVINFLKVYEIQYFLSFLFLELNHTIRNKYIAPKNENGLIMLYNFIKHQNHDHQTSK